jgi:Big-like domain-containing protein
VRIRVLATVAASFVLVPAAASAADLYASPNGTSNMVCGQADPCDIVTAAGNARSGDTVIVEPGSYTPSMTVDVGVVNGPVTIEGEPGAAVPVIDVSSGLGLEMLAGGTISRLDVIDHQNSATGIAVINTDASIDHVYVQVDGTGSTACNMFGTLTDSICWANSSGGVALTLPGLDSASATLRNDTIVAAGTGSEGIAANPAFSPDTMTVEMTNTVARGTSADILIGAATGAASTVTADHSNFANVDNVHGGGLVTPPATPGTDTNQDAMPLFAVPGAGDFFELAGSPTIGAGVDSPLNGTTDLVGHPREIQGKTDIGALEFVPPPTCAAGSAAAKFQTPTTIQLHCADFAGAALKYALVSKPRHGSVSAPTAGGAVTYKPAKGFSGKDSFTFTATSSNGTATDATVTVTVGKEPVPSISHAKLHKGTLQFTLNENASVALTFGRQGHKSVSVKLKGKAGKNSYKLKKLKDGKYTLTIAASNAGGRSKPATLSFKIA